MSGTMFSSTIPRIININGLNVDVAPVDSKILIENDDKPGIVGKIGAVLGTAVLILQE